MTLLRPRWDALTHAGRFLSEMCENKYVHTGAAFDSCSSLTQDKIQVWIQQENLLQPEVEEDMTCTARALHLSLKPIECVQHLWTHLMERPSCCLLQVWTDRCGETPDLILRRSSGEHMWKGLILPLTAGDWQSWCHLPLIYLSNTWQDTQEEDEKQGKDRFSKQICKGKEMKQRHILWQD